MLANAYLDAGDFWSYKQFPEVEGKAVPETPYEHLFVGKAQFWRDFKGSIANLDVAAALTPSPLTFSYRARSLALLAASMRKENPDKSLELIDRAVEDIDIATRLFEIKSPGGAAPRIRSDVLGWHLLVQVHAYTIYRLRGLRDKADEAMTAAAELAGELKTRELKNLGLVRAFIGFYHHYNAERLRGQGMIAQAEDERREAKAFLRDTLFGPWMLVAELVRLDPHETENFAATRDELLDELEKIRNRSPRSNLMLAYHHLLSNEGDSGRSKVCSLVEELKQKPLGHVQEIEICQIYLLLGEVAAAQEFAEQRLDDEESARILPSEKEGLEFYAGDRDIESYLENRGNSGATTYRLFMIGMSELGNGHQADALGWFQQAKDEGIFHSTEFFLALAFAERMERDESWPPWLNSRP
jgi:hypothetical protein